MPLFMQTEDGEMLYSNLITFESVQMHIVGDETDSDTDLMYHNVNDMLDSNEVNENYLNSK